MAFADEIARFKELNNEVKVIKAKIKEIAERFEIEVELDSDDMISLLEKIASIDIPENKEYIIQKGSNLFIKHTGAELTQNENTLVIGV